MIDVVIPAYNAHSTIEKTLLSIIAQTLSDKAQVIIVNDNSEKDYKEIWGKYESLIKIKEIKLDVNSGPGTARRVGMTAGTNPYITFIDADDVFLDNMFFEGVINFLENDPFCVMVSANFLEQNDNNQLHPHQQDMVWVFGKIYRRQYLNKNKIEFSDLWSNEDLEFNNKIRLCLKNTNGKQEHVFFATDKVVYLWKFKEDSITRRNQAEYSYHQGQIGAIKAKLSSYKFPNVNYEQVIREVQMNVIFLYHGFLSILNDRPEHKDWLEAVWEWNVKFWNEVGKKEFNRLTKEEKGLLLNQQNQHTLHIVPNVLFDDFISMLDKGQIDYSKIKEVK
jgi:glycosyltransferase involved in cell wall biosynthesis